MENDKLVNRKLGKKIKFALIMKKFKEKNSKDETDKEESKEYEYIEVRTLKELQENFDIEVVMESFLDKNEGASTEGECKLSEWLDDRRYSVEAQIIRKNRQDYDREIKNETKTSPRRMKMFEEIYKALDVDIEPDRKKLVDLDLKKIEELGEKADRVVTLTNNKVALSHISQVALNQKELDEISKELLNQTGKKPTVYLLYDDDDENNKDNEKDDINFKIKESYLNKIRYVGIDYNDGKMNKIRIIKSNNEYMKAKEVKEKIVKQKKNSLSNLKIIADRERSEFDYFDEEDKEEEINIKGNAGTLQKSSEWFANKGGNSFEAVRTRVIRYMDAGFPLIYFHTFEEDKADEIIKAVSGSRKIYEWSSEGFFKKVRVANNKRQIEIWKDGWSLPNTMRMLSSPILSHASNADSNSNINLNDYDLNNSVLVLKDSYHFLNDDRENNDVAARLKYFSQLIYQGELKDFNIFIVSSQLVIPKELENYMTIIKLEYLTVDEIKKLIKDFCDAQAVDLTDEDFLSQLANSLKGLSEFDIINILALAISSDRELAQSDLELIKDQKKQMIQKTNIMELVEVTENKHDIGGLENLKDWLDNKAVIFRNLEKAVKEDVEIPKGMLIVGMPGCGKSMTAKATATIFNIPLLRMDMGRIMGKYVGESEANMRRALSLAEAISPCVLWIDEIEKAFAGISSDGGGGEVATRLFGTFLTWMQEKKDAAFVVATANNVSHLPPELLRKGRFDEVFYVGLPNANERRKIFEIHIGKLKSDAWKKFWNKMNDSVEGDESIKKLIALTRGYSGAEIAGIVRDVVERAFIEKENENEEEHLEIDVIRGMKLFEDVIEDTSSSSKMKSIQLTLQKYKKKNFKNASKEDKDDDDNFSKRFESLGRRMDGIKEQFGNIKQHLRVIMKIIELLLMILEMFLWLFSKLLFVFNHILKRIKIILGKCNKFIAPLINKMETSYRKIKRWWYNRKKKSSVETEGGMNANE